MQSTRIFFVIALCMLIIWAPWWLVWCCAIALLFYFPNYYEIIIWGIVYDALYGISLPAFWNIEYIFTLFSILLFVMAVILKKRLIMYDAH